MGWEFPTTLFRTGTVLDYLEVNEQLVVYSSQIDGGLNEHNFEADVGYDLLAASKVSENFAIRAFQDATARDLLTTSNLQKVPPTEQWHDCGGEITFGCPGGKCVVMISFQVVGVTFNETHGPGMQFCIELDGAPQMSTLLGGGDISNDRLDTDDVTSSQLPVKGGASFKALYEAHNVEGMFILDSGRHTVRLLGRFVYTGSASIPDHRIGNIETIVLMLRA